MLEITRTRHNPLIDSQLAVWSWEIPLYLFVGGIVAGMMVLAGLAMRRIAKGEDPRRFFSMQTPLLGFVLMNIGMLALLLDLTHRLYVWRIFTTFQLSSPMAWGSWVLIIVYGVLLLSALIRRRRPAVAGAPAGDRACPTPSSRGRHGSARWAGTTSRWVSAWASTPASCSTPWWRARCGTAPSLAPCSWSRAFRPAPR
jgi:hypothetical protein